MAEQLAPNAAVQQCAVGVSVDQVGGFQHPFAKVVEEALGDLKLFVAEGAKVQDG